jgi:methylated-DNA-[protein]-cysteine S-methyltransferase
LLSVPYGETQTYKQVALAIDSNPRTVGRAIGDNPIPIIVPCHRVIGSNGKLVGYAGGIAMKVWLLQHENAIIV